MKCISLKYLVLFGLCLTVIQASKKPVKKPVKKRDNNSSNMTSIEFELTTLPSKIPAIKLPVFCTYTKRPKGCIKPPPVKDPYQGLDKNLVYVIKKLSERERIRMNASTVVELTNKTDIYKVFRGWLKENRIITLVKKNQDCQIAVGFLKFLENENYLAAKEKRASFIDADRQMWFNEAIKCKKECNFKSFMKIKNAKSAFSTAAYEGNDKWKSKIFKNMDKRVQPMCKRTLKLTPPKDANEIKNNVDSISLLTPNKLGNFSKSDSLDIAKALKTNGKKIKKNLAKILGKKIPKDTDVKDVLSIASSIPLECFNNTKASDLVSNLDKMDTSNMNKFRKAFIANKIAQSKDKSVIKDFLIKNSDKTMKNAITTKMLLDLNIDVKDIPAKNLPKSYLKRYAANKLKKESIDKITDTDTLAKVLPGLKKKNLKSIPDNKKIDSLVNMLNASIEKEVSLNSNMRKAMLKSLVKSLIKMNGSDPKSYLGLLTKDHVIYLYPIFIEASETILSAFSSLDTFSTLVKAVVDMPQEKCCDYLRTSREIFTKYAIPTITTNEVLTYANLISLGNCLSSTIPLDLLKSMNETDFMSFYPNAGISFQPDRSQSKEVAAKLTAASADVDKDEFVFETASSLAAYYPSFSSLNATALKEQGSALVEKLKETRSTENKGVQMCRIGLANSDINKLMNGIQKDFVDAYLKSLSGSRRKRSTPSLTCADITDLDGSLNSIPDSTLKTLTATEYRACMATLGKTTNYWSSTQATLLSDLAKSILYNNDASTIPEDDIVTLNAIMEGFSPSCLAKLKLTTSDSVAALGALTGWSEDQQKNGLGPAIKSYLNGKTVEAHDLNTLNNAACSLEKSITDKITDDVFVASVPTLSKIESICPNIQEWYAKATASPSYGAGLINETSQMSELGAIMGGISTSELAQINGDDISSLESNVWTTMPVATVNTLSSDQLQGLSASQVSTMTNSPNYASFSGTIKASADSISAGGSGEVVVADTESNSRQVTCNVITLFLSMIGIFFMKF